ncbi:MAG: DUF1624 domain-containing protein [Candidatus Omnitrophica bacterium]|nr:DUF1624 domain-containing protein [Candidatus Omnitrophota bacterium]
MPGSGSDNLKPAKKRYDSIDVMRAIAIISMVICHFVIYLSSVNGAYPWLYLFANHIVGDFAAPIFVFLVGVSQAVSLGKRPDGGKFFDRAGVRVIKRGLFIMAISFVFSVMTYGPAYVFEWDVLPFIGFSLIVLFLTRKVPVWGLLIAAFLSVIAAPGLRAWSGYSAFWGDIANVPGIQDVLPGFLLDPLTEYEADFVFGNIVKGFFFNGYFPVFPWIAFPLVGYVIGKTNLAGEKIGWFDAKASVLGLLLAVQGLAAAYYASERGLNDVISGFIAPLSFYPDSTTLLSVQLGVCFLLFSFCRAIFDKAPKDNIITGYCRLLSKYSLTIYVFHYIVILWPVWIMGAIKGDIKIYYQNAVSVPIALLSAVILLLLFKPVFWRWNKNEGKYSLEWILSKVVP